MDRMTDASEISDLPHTSYASGKTLNDYHNNLKWKIGNKDLQLIDQEVQSHCSLRIKN